MHESKDIIAKKLKEFRDLENLNQFEFAEDCGISKDTLSLIERSKSNTTIDTLDLLAVRMGISVSELLEASVKTTYLLITSEITVDETTATTYGIGAVQNNELIEIIKDISTNKKKIKYLVNLCNTYDLKLCHLLDVAEDMLE